MSSELPHALRLLRAGGLAIRDAADEPNGGAIASGSHPPHCMPRRAGKLSAICRWRQWGCRLALIALCLPAPAALAAGGSAPPQSAGAGAAVTIMASPVSAPVTAIGPAAVGAAQARSLFISVRYRHKDSTATRFRDMAHDTREYRVRALEGQPARIRTTLEFAPHDSLDGRYATSRASDQTVLEILPLQIGPAGAAPGAGLVALLQVSLQRESRRPGRTQAHDRIATTLRLPLGEWVPMVDDATAAPTLTQHSAEARDDRVNIALRVELAP